MTTFRMLGRVIARAGLLSGLTALLTAFTACTPFQELTTPPVAVAGDDAIFAGGTVALTLDGSRSFDTDGKIIAYEWRYSGWPRGFMPASPTPPPPPPGMVDEDGGMLEPVPPPEPPDPPPNPTTDPLVQPQAFCTGAEIFYDPNDPTRADPIQIRHCLVANAPQAMLTLPPGGYRFTLYVTDDDGQVDGDTVNVIISP